jgi:hypothetical protein
MGALADDPWGAAMWACAAVAGLALLLSLVARARGRSARGPGIWLGLGAFGYLATASASVVLRMGGSDPAAASDGTVADAKSEAKADAKAETKAGDPAGSEAAIAEAKAKDEERVQVDPAISGPPQRTGKEALRFASQVAGDERCKDPRAVAGAVRDLAAAVDSEPKARIDKAVEKLEACRKKIVWVKGASIRRKRIDAREAWVESLKTKMKSEGTPVFVTLRGAEHERIRLGGSDETVGKLRGQFDGTLRAELAGLGFSEVVFADMKDAERFELEAPADHQLAARELATWKLDAPIHVP